MKVALRKVSFLRETMIRANIDALRNQIDDVKEGMVQNIEKVLERGEKIELLVDKTDRLNQQAFRFESSSRNLRRHLYWRRMRNIGICSIFGLIVLFILIADMMSP